MAQFYPLKELPASVRMVIRPMLLLSLALHAALLLTPFPGANSEKSKPEAPKEEKISLTQLPPQTQPVTPQTPPKPATPPPPRPRINIPPRPAALALRRNAPPPPRRVPSRPTQATPQAPAQPIQPTPARPAADAFSKDFPQYPGAQRGSFGLPATYTPFSQKTTAAMEQVGTFFQQELQRKGYDVQTIEANPPQREVFQVSREGTTKYLTLLANPGGSGTNILISDNPLPNDLGAANVVSPEESSFYENLSDILPVIDPNVPDWTNLNGPGTLPEAQAFFKDNGSTGEGGNYTEPQLRDEVDRALLGVNQDPQAVYSDLVTKFTNADYTVESAGNYGGGSLYTVTRDGVTGYLSVVPTSNGVALFFWKQHP